MSTDLEPPPSWTAARARLNALQRHRAADDPEIVAARRDLRAARAEDYIRKLVDAAPPVSEAMRSRLAVLLLQGGGLGDWCEAARSVGPVMKGGWLRGLRGR